MKIAIRGCILAIGLVFANLGYAQNLDLKAYERIRTNLYPATAEEIEVAIKQAGKRYGSWPFDENAYNKGRLFETLTQWSKLSPIHDGYFRCDPMPPYSDALNGFVLNCTMIGYTGLSNDDKHNVRIEVARVLIYKDETCWDSGYLINHVDVTTLSGGGYYTSVVELDSSDLDYLKNHGFIKARF